MEFEEAIKVKLLDPIDGYEAEAKFGIAKEGEYVYDGRNVIRSKLGRYDSRLILTPTKKIHDWSRTSKNVLVYADGGRLEFREIADKFCFNVRYTRIWQAHTGKDICPVDKRCVLVDIEYWDSCCSGSSIPAGSVRWDDVAQYRVVGLAEGWEYES